MEPNEDKGGGASQDGLINAAHAKIREMDEELERLKRLYNNLKAEIIDLRGQIPAPRNIT